MAVAPSASRGARTGATVDRRLVEVKRSTIRRMRRARLAAAIVASLMIAAPARAAEPTKTTLTFKVMIGANKDEPCDVVADLYTPAGVDKAHPAPAIMATNGFGGSKDDFTDLGPAYAKHGYVFLAYSGLGFGGSGCKITLDDREHDGTAGSQLLDFLGGSKAAEDGTKIDYVLKDARDHVGVAHTDDPRVGMVGGSYGGQIQFAVAGVDPRLDTIIPQITWSDLSYSLSPNNTSFKTGVTYDTPGVVKIDWPVLFFGLGTGQGMAAALADPSHVGTCPNFADAVCTSLIQGSARGYLDQGGIELTRNASVSSYYKDIHIPTFLTQGQSDNLFDLQEVVANYKALKDQGVPVKMLWRSSGHSGGGIGKSESDSTNLEAAYETRADLAWFDHYLMDKAPAPALDFSFITDWIPFAEGKDAAASVGVTPNYPAGTDAKLYLSGADALVTDPEKVEDGSAQMAEVAAPTSQGGGAIVAQDGSDPDGTSVSYTTQPLKENLDLVGIPSVTLRVDAPTFGVSADPAQDLLLFAKLYDVAPDGTAKLNRALISAARIADPTKPVTIELPGIVHRYVKGHSLRVTIATSAATYRGGLGAGPVTVKTDAKDPGVLTIPILGPQVGKLGAGPNGATRFALPAKLLPAAKLPKRPACGRKLRFKLRARTKLKVARVRVNGKLVKTVKGKRLRKRVSVRLPRGRARVVVTSRGKRGARRRSARSYPRC
jgi:predicted acyl esterase